MAPITAPELVGIRSLLDFFPVSITVISLLKVPATRMLPSYATTPPTPVSLVRTPTVVSTTAPAKAKDAFV